MLLPAALSCVGLAAAAPWVPLDFKPDHAAPLLAFAGTLLAFEALHDVAEEGLQTLFSPLVLAGFLVLELVRRLMSIFSTDVCCSMSSRKRIRRLATLNLIGDALHNICDGMYLAIAQASGRLNLAIIVSTIMHEIPQEIAEAAIMRAGGYKPLTASLLNALSSSTVLLPLLVPSTYLDHGHEVMCGMTLHLAWMHLNEAANIIRIKGKQNAMRNLCLTGASVLFGFVVNYLMH